MWYGRIISTFNASLTSQISTDSRLTLIIVWGTPGSLQGHENRLISISFRGDSHETSLFLAASPSSSWHPLNRHTHPIVSGPTVVGITQPPFPSITNSWWCLSPRLYARLPLPPPRLLLTSLNSMPWLCMYRLVKLRVEPPSLSRVNLPHFRLL